MMKIFYFSQVSSLFVFNLISNLFLQPVRDHFKEDAHAKDLLKRVKVFELEYLPRFSNGWCLLPIITFSIIGTSNCCTYAGMCVCAVASPVLILVFLLLHLDLYFILCRVSR